MLVESRACRRRGSCLWWSPTAAMVMHCLAGGGYGCPLCPIICCSHEGGLGALASGWAVCFLQPKRLPAGRVPIPVTVLSLENKAAAGVACPWSTSVSESLPRSHKVLGGQQ